MKFSNDLSVFISRRRWLKRITLNFLPKISKYKLFDEFFFYFDPRDMTGPSFHFAYDLEKGFQNYEEQSKEELAKLIPHEGTFYDIGANIGMFTIYLARKRSDINILGFEPEKLAFSCLKNTVESMNKGNITLFNKGVGSKEEEKKLFKSSLNDGGHSFHEEHSKNEKDGKDRDYDIASIVNLDNFINDNQYPLPDAIKIDVEGFELEVLKGSVNTIKRAKPSMLIESNNRDLSDKGPLWTFLSSLEEDGLFAREVCSLEKLDLNELSEVAKEKFKIGHPMSNYLFQFE